MELGHFLSHPSCVYPVNPGLMEISSPSRGKARKGGDRVSESRAASNAESDPSSVGGNAVLMGPTSKCKHQQTEAI